MASLEQMVGTNENKYRVPEKMQQSKGGRKPVGDVINSHSSKPRGNGKSSAKPFNGFKVQQTVLTSTKTGRKRLRKLSNSNKPQEKKSSKKYSTENLSVVSEEEQVDDGEFYGHDHSKCIEARRRAEAMRIKTLLELTFRPEEDSSLLFTPELPTEQSMDLELELEIERLAMMKDLQHLLELKDNSLPRN